MALVSIEGIGLKLEVESLDYLKLNSLNSNLD